MEKNLTNCETEMVVSTNSATVKDGEKNLVPVKDFEDIVHEEDDDNYDVTDYGSDDSDIDLTDDLDEVDDDIYLKKSQRVTWSSLRKTTPAINGAKLCTPNCKRKCYINVTEEECSKILKQFWKLNDHQQQEYAYKTIETPKYSVTQTGGGIKYYKKFAYYLPVGCDRVRVCENFYKHAINTEFPYVPFINHRLRRKDYQYRTMYGHVDQLC